MEEKLNRKGDESHGQLWLARLLARLRLRRQTKNKKQQILRSSPNGFVHHEHHEPSNTQRRIKDPNIHRRTGGSGWPGQPATGRGCSCGEAGRRQPGERACGRGGRQWRPWFTPIWCVLRSSPRAPPMSCRREIATGIGEPETKRLFQNRPGAHQMTPNAQLPFEQIQNSWPPKTFKTRQKPTHTGDLGPSSSPLSLGSDSI